LVRYQPHKCSSCLASAKALDVRGQQLSEAAKTYTFTSFINDEVLNAKIPRMVLPPFYANFDVLTVFSNRKWMVCGFVLRQTELAS
jgi:hypothetical protein